jgi:hypothetical protein
VPSLVEPILKDASPGIIPRFVPEQFRAGIPVTLEIVTLFEEGSYGRLVSDYLSASLVSPMYAIQLSRTRSEWYEDSCNECSVKGCERTSGMDEANTVGM